MKAKSSKVKIRYDADADVLSMEGSPNARIDHAKEMGEMGMGPHRKAAGATAPRRGRARLQQQTMRDHLVVHFGKNDEPVLIEVLEASSTLRGQTKPFQQIATLSH